jgi:hypothetical protein
VHWKDRIEAAFLAQEMNGKWEKFISHINDQTLSELGLLSMIFETSGKHASIDEGERQSLLVSRYLCMHPNNEFYSPLRSLSSAW